VSEDLTAALGRWPLDAPAVATDVGGFNNRTYVVADRRGRWVLRLYPRSSDEARARFEHRLLARLAAADLSFAVPMPVPDRNGETLVAVTFEGHEALASLAPLLPGGPPSRDGADDWVCGHALGELDTALGALPASMSDGALPSLHGRRDRLDEIGNLPSEIALERSERAQLAAIGTAAAEDGERLDRDLPRQCVHRDFDASNVLVMSGRVTAVLDFEFAGWDLRVMDLAAALILFRGHPWVLGVAGLESLIGGYGATLRLTNTEVQAVPAAMRLTRVGRLIRREARRREGRARPGDVLSRARELLRLDAWLAAHEEALVAMLHEAMAT
jgi:homoserine kinase type II